MVGVRCLDCICGTYAILDGAAGAVEPTLVTLRTRAPSLRKPHRACIFFFTTIMPIGLLMRAMGRDPMRLRREPEAKSYWIKREPPKPAANNP